MKKKIMSTALAFLGLFILGSALLVFLGAFKEQQAGIFIESEPASKVFINNQEVGNTPYEASLKAGEISIKIKPETTDDQILDDYETKVNLAPGIKTIIKRNFEPNDNSSSGITVSFEKINGDSAYITIVSQPNNAQVNIDEKNYGYTPIKIKVSAGDHNLTVLKNDYFEQKLPIKIYKGYKLTALIKLAKIPKEEQVSGISNIVIDLGKIKINKNDVGFLRVRSGTSTGFPEVAQVKPDEIYDILEEGENGSWYKIKVDETEGWVSGEFVVKI